jgi:membrane-associated protease RseP (regulator of RpoE activity)
LNLLPVGQLDGGRIAQAAFGRRVLSATSLGTYLGLTFGILGSTLSLPWALFVLICQRTPDYAPKDDVSPVSDQKQTLAFACIAIAFLILLPGASLVPSDLDSFL